MLKWHDKGWPVCSVKSTAEENLQVHTSATSLVFKPKALFRWGKASPAQRVVRLQELPPDVVYIRKICKFLIKKRSGVPSRDSPKRYRLHRDSDLTTF
jgi:hypothetical protein